MSLFLVSLGSNCQVAYQLRRLSKHRVKGFFDWLVSPHSSLVKVLLENFQNVFNPEALMLIEQGKAVLDTRTGLKAYHAFPFNEHGLIEESEIINNATIVQKRFYEVIAASDEALRGRRVLFIRLCEPGVCEDADALIRALILYYSATDCKLLALNFLSKRGSYSRSHVHHATVNTKGPLQKEWQGDDLSWEKVLAECISLIYPDLRVY